MSRRIEHRTERRLAALNLLAMLLLVLPVHVTGVAAAPLGSAAPVIQAVAPAAVVQPAAAPALPVELQVTLAAPILHPGGATDLLVTVTNYSPEPLADLWLSLNLPPGVEAEPGVNERQPLPVLAGMTSHTAALPLTLHRARAPAQDGVHSVSASVGAPGYEEHTAAAFLGIASKTPERAARPDPRRPHTTIASELGALLEDDVGELTLLAAPAAVAPATVFTYTPLYRWDQPGGWHAASSGLTATLTGSPAIAPVAALTTAMTLPYRILLPNVAGNGLAPAGEAESEPVRVAAPAPGWAALRALARQEEGIYFVHQWQLDAVLADQSVHHFAEPVAITLNLARLQRAGVDPTLLNLWTRPGPGARWRPVPTRYDPEHTILTAWAPHFSQFGLGAGLMPSGDLLPNVKAFTVDELNGGAAVQIPVEAPKGLGGLAPNIGFNFASITLDDLRRVAGDYEMLAQASSIGIGWRLEGVSYIARTDDRFDDDTPDTEKEFALVLNGMRVGIQFQDGLWRTNPELFARVTWNSSRSGDAHDFGGWTITLPNGMRYQFGAAGSFVSTFDPASATATALERTYGGRTFRLARRWYLRQVTDPLGNSMEFRYRGEKEWESGCVEDSWIAGQKHWYTRTIDPTEILWSGNPGQGVSHKLRMLFTYVGGREDYQVRGRRTNDCIQAMFGFDNQLADVQVQVWDSAANTWHTLRTYALTQGFKRFTAAEQESKKRLYLAALETRGQDGGVLQRHAFTYDFANTNLIFLRRAENGAGGATNFGYTGHRVSCSNSVCPYTKTRHAVINTSAEDGLGHSVQTTYYYGPADAPGSEWGAVAGDGGFLGYKSVEISHFDLDAPGAVLRWEKLESFDGGAAAARDNPDPRRGKLRRREVRANASAPTAAVETYDWRAYWLENGAWSTTATDRTDKETDGVVTSPVTWLRLEKATQTVDAASNEERYSYEGRYGNRTVQQDFADGSLLRTTVTDYFPNSAAYIGDRPARTRVFAGSAEGGACLQENRFLYDTDSATYLAPPQLGLLTQVQRAVNRCSEAPAIDLNDSGWITTRYVYDGGAPRFGNRTRTEILGVAGALSTDYDSIYYLFPIRQSTGAYVESATYYGVNGLPLADGKAYWGALQEQCGVGGLCTRQAYDEFGRPLRQWAHVPAGASWASDEAAAVSWAYRARGTYGLLTTMVNEWHAPRCTGNFVRRHYDGFGQLVQEQRPADEWSTDIDGCTPGANYQEIDVDYAYDGLGRQRQVTVPQAVTGSWINRRADWNNPPPNTATTYDALDRPVRVSAPNGAITDYKYADRKTAVVGRGRNGDPDKVIQWRELDGLGNLRRVRSHSKPYDQGGVVEGEVQLSYDVLGNLRQVIHPLSIGQTTFTYDLVGRKTGISDPDLGAWSYSYDKRGQLVRQTDARGKTICLGYDLLGRLVRKSYLSEPMCPAAPSADVVFAYDQNASATNRALGQLTEVRLADGSYRKAITYNELGLPAMAAVTIAGAPQTYTERYAYDLYQRHLATVYPNGEVMFEQPNSRGLPKLLCRAVLYIDGRIECGTTLKLVDGAVYNASGQLTSVTYPAGGGVERTQRYYPWAGAGGDSNGLLAAIDLKRDGNPLLTLSYAYDTFANLRQITHNGVASSFTYDGQDRLTSAYGRNYVYDGAGRHTRFEGVNLTISTGHPHATMPADGGYGFDANGNVTNRRGQILTWDHENRLTSVTGANLDERYRYAPDGQRIVKISNGVTTYYPFPSFEVTSNGTVKHYFFGGQRIAQRTGAILSYYHGDHLGSTVLATDGAGTPLGEERYYAYGQDRSSSVVPTDQRFTGQRTDASGLMYFNARYYDPAVGQFLSPDPLIPDAAVLLDYNRYLYTRGNPLKYSDPSGHIAVCFKGGAANSYNEAATANAFYQLCTQTLADAGYDERFHGAIQYFGNGSAQITAAELAVRSALAENPYQPVFVLGYSWGGAAALDLVDRLNQSDGAVGSGPDALQRTAATSVDGLILFDAELDLRTVGALFPGSDSVNSPDTISSNVRRAVNLYAEDGAWLCDACGPRAIPWGIDGPLNPQNGVNHLERALNVGLAVTTLSPAPVDHHSIVHVGSQLTPETRRIAAWALMGAMGHIPNAR